jgi:hypothetical protein
MICETFTTEGFDSPVPRTGRRTMLGASASRTLEVITAAMTVAMRLTLKLLGRDDKQGPAITTPGT